MRIIFDNIIYSLQHYGGVSVVWNNLISRIVNTNNDVRFIEYDDAEMNIARKRLQLPSLSICRMSARLMSIRRYFNPTLPHDILPPTSDNHPFIFHSSYFRVSADPRAVNITTVHDFTYELYVKNWLKRKMHCSQKHAAIRKADHVVCISENTRRDLLRLLPDVDPSKVSVIYNGVENHSFYVLPEVKHHDYALFVGRRDDYKNFLTILRPLAELNIPLHIVGARLSNAEIKALDESEIQYKYLGLVTDEELNRLYNEALFLFYPSKYEGFGLPILEAQMAGCPVLAFHASSIPEIIGDPQLMLNEITADAIASRVALFRDPENRAKIVSAGLANASRFTWERMAEAYLQLYQTLKKECVSL